MKVRLNLFLEIYLILVIIRHIIAIFNALTRIQLASYGLASVPAEIWNILLSIMMIITLIFILKIKRWAIYIFACIHVINIIIQSSVFGEDLLVLIFVAIAICSIFAALLCIRKNGVSAWRLFFPKNTKQTQNKQSVIKGKILNKSTNDVNNLTIKEIEENGIDKKNENNSYEFEAYLNEVNNHIANLPRNEKGSLDYEKMTSIQRFAYTYKYDSPEIALEDLKQEIKISEETIARIQKEISEAIGGKRLKLRDLLRREQELLDEQNHILLRYSNIKYNNKLLK